LWRKIPKGCFGSKKGSFVSKEEEPTRDVDTSDVTYSTVDIKLVSRPPDELREPLLTN